MKDESMKNCVATGLAILLGVMSLVHAAGAAEHVLAPGGTLRAVYLAGNPAQAIRDASNGTEIEPAP